MFDPSKLSFSIEVPGCSSRSNLRMLSQRNYVLIQEAARDAVQANKEASAEQQAEAVVELAMDRLAKRLSATNGAHFTLPKRLYARRYWQQCIVAWARISLVLEMYRNFLVILDPDLVAAALNPEDRASYEPGFLHGLYIEETCRPFQLLKQLFWRQLPEGPNRNDKARDLALAAVIDPITSEHSPERAQFLPARWPAQDRQSAASSVHA